MSMGIELGVLAAADRYGRQLTLRNAVVVHLPDSLE
jgi:hypothetical protein